MKPVLQAAAVVEEVETKLFPPNLHKDRVLETVAAVEEVETTVILLTRLNHGRVLETAAAVGEVEPRTRLLKLINDKALILATPSASMVRRTVMKMALLAVIALPDAAAIEVGTKAADRDGN